MGNCTKKTRNAQRKIIVTCSYHALCNLFSRKGRTKDGFVYMKNKICVSCWYHSLFNPKVAE